MIRSQALTDLVHVRGYADFKLQPKASMGSNVDHSVGPVVSLSGCELNQNISIVSLWKILK